MACPCKIASFPHWQPRHSLSPITTLLRPFLPSFLPFSTLHGDGLNTRNFLYVEDVAAAFDIVLHKGTIGTLASMLVAAAVVLWFADSH